MASKPQRDREIVAMERVFATLNRLASKRYAQNPNTVGSYMTGGENAVRRVLEYVGDRLGYTVVAKR